MRALAWSLGAAAVGIGLFATANLPIVVACAVAVGVAVAIFNVALITLVQRRTDVTMQGRVMAALEAAFTLPMVISTALGAGLVAVVGFRAIYLAEAVGLLGVTIYLLAVSRNADAVEPVADPAPDQAAVDSIEAS
jgi:MFS family permease